MGQEHDEGNVTNLIHRAAKQDKDAIDRLYKVVYDNLRLIAKSKMQSESQLTYQPTALVHDTYIRLFGKEASELSIQDRNHFYALVALVMRNVLVNKALARDAIKRGSGNVGAVNDAELEGLEAPPELAGIELSELNEAMQALRTRNAIIANAVDLRFFSGLTVEEVGIALQVSRQTAHTYINKGITGLRRLLEGWYTH